MPNLASYFFSLGLLSSTPVISLPDGAMTLSVQHSIAWSLLWRVRTQMGWLLSVSPLRSSAVLTVERGFRASQVVSCHWSGNEARYAPTTTEEYIVGRLLSETYS